MNLMSKNFLNGILPALARMANGLRGSSEPELSANIEVEGQLGAVELQETAPIYRIRSPKKKRRMDFHGTKINYDAKRRSVTTCDVKDIS